MKDFLKDHPEIVKWIITARRRGGMNIGIGIGIGF